MELLNLSAPEQHDYNDPTVERDERRLRDWLTNLPLMDVVETVRLVQGGLQALNEQKLELGLRFRLLDEFRSTIHRLFVTVDPMHLRQLALSKVQREQATEGVEQLLLSMAGGYKVIIREIYSADKLTESREMFGLSVHRCLEQLGYALLDSYRFYRAVQPDLFSELHQLYRLARHHGLLDVMTPDEDDVERQVTTAARYHTVLLLSLTDPFRLAEGEVGMLKDVLVQHAALCRVIPGYRADMVEGQYLVDLRGGKPPEPAGRNQEPDNFGEPYLLDARQALTAVRDRLAKTPAKVRSQSPEAIVLRLLLPEDASVDRRRESRYPDSRWVKLLLGVEHIHGWLTRAAGKDSHGMSGEPPPCRVTDTSEHGMGLAWEGGGTGDVRVGELIGVIDEGKSPKLAIVRSIRVYREGGMELGVQLIQGSSAPVYCRLAGEGEEEMAVRTLFMPASSEEQVAATIVAPKGLYEQGRRLLIEVAGRDVHARAGRCVFEGAVFDRFEFSSDDDG